MLYGLIFQSCNFNFEDNHLNFYDLKILISIYYISCMLLSFILHVAVVYVERLDLCNSSVWKDYIFTLIVSVIGSESCTSDWEGTDPSFLYLTFSYVFLLSTQFLSFS